MTSTDILAVLGDIIREVIDDPGFDVTASTSAKDHEAWDSFSHINIVVAAELRFGVKFHTAEIERLGTVGEFADLIAQKSAAA